MSPIPLVAYELTSTQVRRIAKFYRSTYEVDEPWVMKSSIFEKHDLVKMMKSLVFDFKASGEKAGGFSKK